MFGNIENVGLKSEYRKCSILLKISIIPLNPIEYRKYWIPNFQYYWIPKILNTEFSILPNTEKISNTDVQLYRKKNSIKIPALATMSKMSIVNLIRVSHFAFLKIDTARTSIKLQIFILYIAEQYTNTFTQPWLHLPLKKKSVS